MLCLMAENARLLNFYFSTGNFKTYSTVRYLGMLDNNNTISDNDVYYRDIQDKFEPDPDTYFEVRGGIRLGFRQLDNARWPASPLYTLRIKNPKLAQQLSQEDSVLHIKLEKSVALLAIIMTINLKNYELKKWSSLMVKVALIRVV